MMQVFVNRVNVDQVVDVALETESDILVAVREMEVTDVIVTAVDFSNDDLDSYDIIEDMLNDVVDQLNCETLLAEVGRYFWDYRNGMYYIGFEVTGSEDA